ncbi:MAG: glycoside hydrolase family 127 protein [Defluviitaleaceae bacterium]|nr:glycoside hydrolase family 127 protein [Defluviitaleaceae bacterium]
MEKKLRAIPLSDVDLLDGVLKERTAVNKKYLMSLKNENLLQNYYMEALLWTPSGKPEGCHWGWESPTSQVRGQFLGHWLSAAAILYCSEGDAEVKAKADYIVSELARCQRENGGEWAAAIPEKYLHRIAEGKWAWASLYVVHKTFMGLLDMYEFAGNQQALDIAVNFAKWFVRWTADFTQEQMDNILETETGGMFEVMAKLYATTKDPEHLQLMKRFERRRLFDRLISGEDALTRMHANTTIPEILGAAYAYDITGNDRWLKAVEAYWRCAVTERGYFCTGGQTNGELWCPPFEFAADLGALNQEHCTVYNMMRLAQWLFVCTSDVKYADYIERNIYNGILAQQHPDMGIPTYFLPLGPGARKKWDTLTETFWCCNGTVLQANSIHESFIFYGDNQGVVIGQYFPAKLKININNTAVEITQEHENWGHFSNVVKFTPPRPRRPKNLTVIVNVKCEQPTDFTLKLRIPRWVVGAPEVTVNGEESKDSFKDFYEIKRVWSNDNVCVVFPKSLVCEPIPDKPDMIAFMDGPVVLAGLCENERALFGSADNPEGMLRPADGSRMNKWTGNYITQNQPENIKFMPLYEIVDERYTVYFPVKRP